MAFWQKVDAEPGPFKLLLRSTCPENVKTREDSLIFTHSQNIPHFQAIAGPFKLLLRATCPENARTREDEPS